MNFLDMTRPGSCGLCQAVGYKPDPSDGLEIDEKPTEASHQALTQNRSFTGLCGVYTF
jgi:hypothetical protein